MDFNSCWTFLIYSVEKKGKTDTREACLMLLELNEIYDFLKNRNLLNNYT